MDYFTLPMLPTLHVRKKLIPDLSASGVLALVELGLLALLVHLPALGDFAAAFSRSIRGFH